MRSGERRGDGEVVQVRAGRECQGGQEDEDNGR